MDRATRRRFDKELEAVLAELPPRVQQLLEEVPLHVEDYPPPEVLAEFGMTHRDELCGLHSGVPLNQRSIDQPWRLPDVVTIYREGILAAATGEDGRVSRRRLREEIRITILHELAHHFGMSEEELEELGYG